MIGCMTKTLADYIYALMGPPSTLLQLKLIPLLPDGDCPFHFEGSLEQQQHRSGGDVECVAYFDGDEWTLQLVQAHLRAK